MTILAEAAQPGSDLALELYATNERIDLLAEALGRPVEVVQAGGNDHGQRRP